MSYTVPTRWSTPADADALAHLHADAWRYAYSGVIPDPGLSRLISRRGPEIWELYVHPDCHGAGYGRGLFEIARDQFTEAGLAPLNVWCLEGNELGLNFYRALGGEESACGSYRIAGAQLGARRFTWH